MKSHINCSNNNNMNNKRNKMSHLITARGICAVCGNMHVKSVFCQLEQNRDRDMVRKTKRDLFLW